MLVVFIYYGCVVLNVYVQEKGRLLMMSIVSTQEDNDNVNYLVLLGRLAFIGIYILQNVVEIGITVALAVLIEKKS